ncbi:MAG: AbrB/MazE/SpoVT family DNA-binding domain-containing protein [Bosea sp. (in: a-proteobacteria)]
MQISKWGNSLAVRLPKALTDELGLKAGDEVTMVAQPDGTIALAKDERRARAIERFRTRAWPLPPNYKFDRDEANERGQDLDDKG